MVVDSTYGGFPAGLNEYLPSPHLYAKNIRKQKKEKKEMSGRKDRKAGERQGKLNMQKSKDLFQD